MVYCIGLAGGIASGKTTIAHIFASLGARVLSADTISRKLTRKNESAYEEIVSHFGSHILDEQCELNRRLLRDIIFSTPEEKIWLEQLLHPLIRKNLEFEASLDIGSYSILEIPLLINNKDYPYLNRILFVTTSEEVQIMRVMQRDSCTKQQALAILANQTSLEDCLKYADDVIINNGRLEQLTVEVQQLHLIYSKAATGA
jgi:dephospho-CoA kinase